MTLLGSFLWCTVLAWFGDNLLGDRPELVQDPALMLQILQERSYVVGAFAAVIGLLYVLVMRLTAEPKSLSQ